MADRTVKVTLTAQVAGYIAGMNEAAKKTKTNEDNAKALESQLLRQGRAFDLAGTTALKFGAVAAAGVALAVAKFASFDQAMSNVQAALQVSTANLAKLRADAIDAGAKTVYSAEQAANAIEELGKNGLTTTQILSGGLAGALNLATAGQLDVGRAAEVAAVSMKQFGLQGSAIPHIADLLAAGAGKAAGDVEDLAQALAQGGLVAHNTGLSIDDTTGVLSAFADQGLKGSDAGTSFKTMLQALTPSSKQAKDEIAKLGISAYDSQGQFIGITQYAGLLKDKLGALTPQARNAAESIVFGSDGIRAATILYNQGAAGIQKYIDQTNDSGYAAKVAADRMNNLAGDLEQLKGSIDTALIQTGSGANDTLRQLTQNVTFLVNGIGDLPGPVTNAALALGVATAAVGLLGGGALKMVPKITAARAVLAEMGITGRTAAAGVGVATLALTAVTLALGGFISAQADAAAQVEAYEASLDAATGKTTAYTRQLVATKLAQKETFAGIDFGAGSPFDAAKKLGISLDLVTDAASGNVEALEKYKTISKTIPLNNDDAYESFNLLNSAIIGENGNIDQAIKIAKQKQEADASTTDSNDQVTQSYTQTADAVDGVVTSLSDLINELDAAQNKTLGARAAARDLEAAYDAFDAGLKKNGNTLDISTEKGRANQENLDNIAASAQKSADAILDTTGSTHKYRQSLVDSRDALLNRIHDLGVHGQKAKDLADDLLKIPSKTDVAVAVDIDPALAALNVLKSRLNGILNGSLKVDLNGTVSGNGRLGTFASGGAISGPGSGTSDSIPAVLSNGEHVLTAAEVAKAGGQGAVYAARSRLMGGSRLAFAKGGAVAASSAVSGFSEVDDPAAAERERIRQAKLDAATAVLTHGLEVAAAKSDEFAKSQEAAAAAEKDLADAAKSIADQFDSIDLSSLSDDVQKFTTVVNADGSTSVFGSTVAGAPTAESIDAYFAGQNADDARFAAKLKQLAGTIPSGLLQYITSLGVAKGEPYADALLAGSATTIASINANYNATQSSASLIGGIIAPLIGHASGGAVYGAGSGTSDSVLRRLSNGEHVLTAGEVQALGGQASVYAMRAAWRSGGPGQYASSTPVSSGASVTINQTYQGESSASQRRNDALAFAKVGTL